MASCSGRWGHRPSCQRGCSAVALLTRRAALACAGDGKKERPLAAITWPWPALRVGPRRWPGCRLIALAGAISLSSRLLGLSRRSSAAVCILLQNCNTSVTLQALIARAAGPRSMIGSSRRPVQPGAAVSLCRFTRYSLAIISIAVWYGPATPYQHPIFVARRLGAGGLEQLNQVDAIPGIFPCWPAQEERSPVQELVCTRAPPAPAGCPQPGQLELTSLVVLVYQRHP